MTMLTYVLLTSLVLAVSVGVGADDVDVSGRRLVRRMKHMVSQL